MAGEMEFGVETGGGLGFFGGEVDEFEEACGGGVGGLYAVIDVAHFADRVEGSAEANNGGEEEVCLDFFLEDHGAAVDDEASDDDHGEDFEDGVGGGVDVLGFCLGACESAVLGFEAAGFGVFGTVGLDDADSGEAFAEMIDEATPGRGGFLLRFLDAAAEGAHGEGAEGEANGGDDKQTPVDGDGEGEDAEGLERFADGFSEKGSEADFDLGDVGGEAADGVAGRVAAVPIHGESQDVRAEMGAQVVHGVLDGGGDEALIKEAADAAEDGDGDEGDHDSEEAGEAALGIRAGGHEAAGERFKM